MILTLIKKINTNIASLVSLLPSSKQFIDLQYIENTLIDVLDVHNIGGLSQYLYILYNFLDKIKEFKKEFNENIIFKIQEVENTLKDVINNATASIKKDIKDFTAYIKNSNSKELKDILYIIYISDIDNIDIINEIKYKVNDDNVYLRHKVIYDYDYLLNGKLKVNDTMGLTSDVVNQTRFINDKDKDLYTKVKKDKIIELHSKPNIGDKYINCFLNDFYTDKTLVKKKYTNRGKLIDINKSNEIKIYNEYVKGNSKGEDYNRLEVSVFEAFNV